jgi:hypothetical protein
MSSFVNVEHEPETLDKGCFLVPKISFIEQIKKCKGKQPRNGKVSMFHLRQVIGEIGAKYLGIEFDPVREVNISHVVGRTFNTDEEFDSILVELFDKSCPKVFDGFVMYHLKKRPLGTKLVYFLPKNRGTKSLYELGLQPIAPKDVDVFLGKKEKKVVGKPAVKDKKPAKKATSKTVSKEDVVQ